MIHGYFHHQVGLQRRQLETEPFFIISERERDQLRVVRGMGLGVLLIKRVCLDLFYSINKSKGFEFNASGSIINGSGLYGFGTGQVWVRHNP